MRIIKNGFIPHKDNDYKPYFLRGKSILFVTSFVLLVEFVFLIHSLVIIPNTKFFAAILPKVLVDDTNDSRVANEIGALKVSSLLEAAAKEKAEDMVRKGYFAHVSPEGLTPWHWFREAGYNFAYAGENLAVNFTDSKDITKAWLNSPTHKANILNQNFTEIGIGTAKGNFEGREVVFVVQLFGRPALAKAKEVEQIVRASSELVSLPSSVQIKNDMFVAIKGAETYSVNPEVSGNRETKSIASLIGKIITRPKTSTDYVYFSLGLILVLALILKIFIKIEIQHPRLILNGLLALTFVATSFFLNSKISLL